MIRFLPLLLLVQTIAFAQKVDLDRGRFNLTYRQFPTNPLPADYRT